MSKEKIEKYMINKFCGGSANNPPAKNLQFELEDGYEFGAKIVAGVEKFGIIKKK